MISAEDKELFFTVFSGNGYYSWTTEYKKKYIYYLRKISDTNSKKLPESIISNTVNDIFSRISDYDSELHIFKSFHQKYELYTRKSIEIYKTKLSETDKVNLKSVSQKPYDFTNHMQWTLIGIENQSNKIEYTFAKNSQKIMLTKLSEASLDQETWEKIFHIANKKANVFGDKLLTVEAKLLASKRLILKLSVDIDSDYLDIGYDDFQVDENGKKINETFADGERLCVIKNALNNLPIEEATKEQLKNNLQQGRSIFTRKTLEKFCNVRESNLVIIPRIQTFDREDETIPENSERVTSDLFRQKLHEILKKIRDTYESKGTLEGFFQQYQEHNTNNAKTINELLNAADTKRTSFNAYCIVVRNATEYEKPVANTGYLKDKIIDSISIDYDFVRKELCTRNAYYAKETYDTIISKIRQIFESQ